MESKQACRLRASPPCIITFMLKTRGRQLILPGWTFNVELLQHLSEGCNRLCDDIESCHILLLYLQRVLEGQNIWMPHLLQGVSK